MTSPEHAQGSLHANGANRHMRRADVAAAQEEIRNVLGVEAAVRHRIGLDDPAMIGAGAERLCELGSILRIGKVQIQTPRDRRRWHRDRRHAFRCRSASGHNRPPRGNFRVCRRWARPRRAYRWPTRTCDWSGSSSTTNWRKWPSFHSRGYIPSLRPGCGIGRSPIPIRLGGCSTLSLR